MEVKDSRVLSAPIPSTRLQDVQVPVPHPELFNAARQGDIEEVKRILSCNVDINKGELTPLYIAAENGHTEIVKLLLDAGAKVDETTLYCVAQFGNTELLALLLEAGADVNGEKDYDSPLYVAGRYGNTETVKLLLKAGANVNKTGFLGATPLFVAYHRDHLEVVDILLEAGADKNILYNIGKNLQRYLTFHLDP